MAAERYAAVRPLIEMLIDKGRECMLEGGESTFFLFTSYGDRSLCLTADDYAPDVEFAPFIAADYASEFLVVVLTPDPEVFGRSRHLQFIRASKETIARVTPLLAMSPVPPSYHEWLGPKDVAKRDRGVVRMIHRYVVRSQGFLALGDGVPLLNRPLPPELLKALNPQRAAPRRSPVPCVREW